MIASEGALNRCRRLGIFSVPPDPARSVNYTEYHLSDDDICKSLTCDLT